MSLLSSHLQQIAFSAQSIASLPFPPPKIFTNALLTPHDITSLIRDTEPHERALFSVPPPPPREKAATLPDPDEERKRKSSRRQTVFNVAGGEITTGPVASRAAPRRNTAVAAVLGQDLNARIRREEGSRDLDIEVLLRGAEKLGEVFYMEGASEKIAQLRQRNQRIQGSVRYYEEKVVEQTRQLELMNRHGEDGDDDGYSRRGSWAKEQGHYDEDEEMGGMDDGGAEGDVDEMIRQEEAEIRELEERKRELEERVRGMEKDLGGLLR